MKNIIYFDANADVVAALCSVAAIKITKILRFRIQCCKQYLAQVEHVLFRAGANHEVYGLWRFEGIRS